MWPENVEHRGFPAPGRGKYLCQVCQWAAKGPCPLHPGESLAMGKKWRPGKQGTKWRLWDNHVHGSGVEATARPPGWPGTLGAGYNGRYVTLDMASFGAVDANRGATQSRYTDPVGLAIYSRTHRGSDLELTASARRKTRRQARRKQRNRARRNALI